MSGNTIGRLFQVTTFGESHGPAIGCVVDGCPPGLELTEADFARDIDRIAIQLETFIEEFSNILQRHAGAAPNTPASAPAAPQAASGTASGVR